MTPDTHRLIAGDMMKARQYLRALDAERSGTLQAEALTLAAVVSYCRPFLCSRDLAGKRTWWIPEAWVDELSADGRRVHDRLIDARNQAWAHTDYRSHVPVSGTSRVLVISHNPWVALSPSDITAFHNLIDEIDRRLEDVRERS